MRLAVAASVVFALHSAVADAGRGANLVKYLRDDTTYVLVIDVEHARELPLFQKVFEIVHTKLGWWDDLGQGSPTFDKLLDTVLVGGTTGADGSTRYVVVVDGRIDKLVAAAKAASKQAEVYAGTTVWTIDSGQLAVIDRRLVFTPSGAMHEAIDRARAKAKLKLPATVRGFLADAPHGTAMFGGMLIDTTASDQAAGMIGARPTSVAISIAAATKMTIELHVQLPDDATAAKAVSTVAGLVEPVRAQLEQFIGKEFSDSISVDQERSQLRISAAMTSEEVDRLVAILKMTM